MSISSTSNGIDIVFFSVWSLHARDAVDAIDEPLYYIAIRSPHRNASISWHRNRIRFDTSVFFVRTFPPDRTLGIHKKLIFILI